MLLPTLSRATRARAPLSLLRSLHSTPLLHRPVSLLTPKELSTLLTSPTADTGGDVVVLDASWHMPNLDPPRDAWGEYRKKRIEGAGFWHQDQIASTSPLSVPHNMPTKELFEDACSRLGISRESHVVLYDSTGVFSSPRGAFTFKHFAHDQVSILDGGLPRWVAEGYPTSNSSPANPNPHALLPGEKARYQPIFSELLYAVKPRVESYFIADIEELFTDYKVPDGAEQGDVRQWEDLNGVIGQLEGSGGREGDVVLDARPEGRFLGTAPEPRPGLSSGHMPHAYSLPFPELLTGADVKTLKPAAELEDAIKSRVGDEVWQSLKSGERGVTTTCGSGMTAAVLWLGLQRAGVSADKIKLYDESWTGYAQRPESKIVKS
ncbi:hypothetical protein JCM10207_005861 [Rhodosporidiobolus poonsookiae]